MDKFLSRRIPITLKRLEKIIQASSDEANAEEQSWHYLSGEQNIYHPNKKMRKKNQYNFFLLKSDSNASMLVHRSDYPHYMNHIPIQ